MKITKAPDPFAKLPALAERLGVKPATEPGFHVATQDGLAYDVFEIVTAVLDRLDSVSPPRPRTA